MPGLLPLVCLACLSFLRPHPIHVTISDVTVNEKAVEWNIRIYTDDLLLAMYGKHATPRQIGELDDIRRDLLKYLSKHVRLEQDGLIVTWMITRIGQDPEALSVTLVGNLSSRTAPLLVHNNCLTAVYADQKNIVNMTVNGNETHLLFGKGDSARSISP